MRYRQLDANGDYMLGQNAFLVNSPQAVAQAVQTRLALWLGEWFIGVTDGTPWDQQILGKNLTGRNPDAAIKQRILSTPGVTEIVSYSSNFDGNARTLSVNATINTVYGQTTIQVTQ